MLITGTKNSCLKKYLNIFYKYENYMLTMGSGGNYNGTTRIEINDLEDVFVDYLKDLSLSGMVNRPQRYTFLNMTISLLEVIIKNEIVTEIKGNRTFYRKYWHMMLINGIPGKRNGEKMDDYFFAEPVQFEYAIPEFFTYQSFWPISLIVDSFSCVENFIQNEFPKSGKFTKNFELFFNARNGSTHDLDDLDINLADNIKNNLHNFIETIKKMISRSLEYRKKIEKKPITSEDQRILEVQKKWLDKVNEAVEKGGGCGKCKKCKKFKRTRCENRVVPSELWYGKNRQLDEDFEFELKTLRSLLK